MSEQDNSTTALAPIHLDQQTETDLASVLAEGWARDTEAAEMFARYEQALASGIIGRLADFTIQHGQAQPYGWRWIVKRDGVTLEASYDSSNGALIIKRNDEDEAVLDEWAHDGVVIFSPGKRGLWIQTLLLEHERLERAAKQHAILEKRRAETEAKAKSERDI